MKKIFFICAFFLALSVSANGKITDTLNTNIQGYQNELGYFQRANRDMSDPRFMFYDSKSKMEFGVGGAVRVAGYYGFAGEVEDHSFVPSLISLPVDKAPRFGTKISASEVHFKARYRWNSKKTGNPHSIIAFFKIGGNSSNIIEIKQAYVSFDGLSIGKVPSFFDDIEVGVKTTGISDNSLVDKDIPLFGYTYRLKQNWEFAAALEKPEVYLDYYSDYFPYMNKIYPEKYPSSFVAVRGDYPPMPDISLHGKYRWTSGHVQLAGILREMAYWCRREENDLGISKYTFGWGVSLTGSYRPLRSDKLVLNAELVGGCGISDRMPDYSQICYMMGIRNNLDPSGYCIMTAAPVVAAQLAAQYKWNSFLQSTFIASYRSYLRNEDTSYWYKHSTASMGEMRSTVFALANIIWNIGDYAHVGLEYMFGAKQLYTEPNYYAAREGLLDLFTEWGISNRIAVEFAFYF